MKFNSRNVVLSGLALLLSQSVNAQSLFVNPSKALTTQPVQSVTPLQKKRNVLQTKLYSVNANALVAGTEQVHLRLGNINIYANKVSSEKTASGGLAWVGGVAKSTHSKAVFEPNNSVLLVNRNGRITGSVWVDGRLFKIAPLSNGLHQVSEMAAVETLPDHPENTMVELNQQLDLEQLDGKRFDLEAADATLVAKPTIKMLVLYTNGVTSEVSDIAGLIDLAILETNTGFTHSNINARVELAYQTRVGYNSSSISTDLNRLKSSSDNYMHNAHILRDSVGADVVMLLTPGSQSSCGQAAAIGASSTTAFAVTAQDCATGYYSFGHELGHLLAARHNPEADSNNSPYAFGHGYQAPDQSFRTVMSYDCSSGCSRVLWWSNPDINYNNQATGTAVRHDNARVLDLRAPTVAGFRADPAAGAAVCQFDKALSYVDEFYESIYGYDEGNWSYRWEGSVIASGEDPDGWVQPPDEVISGGYRYYLSTQEERETGGYSRDEFWEYNTYRICRVKL